MSGGGVRPALFAPARIAGIATSRRAEFILGGGSGIGLSGLVISTLLGIVGAIVGGFVSVQLGYGDVTGFNVRSLVIAVLGAIAVIIVFRALSSRGGRRGGLI